jgi:hypothetical protein
MGAGILPAPFFVPENIRKQKNSPVALGAWREFE